MHIAYEENKASYFITLQKILAHYNLNTLAQDEITFLQLYYLEKIEIGQIASLLEKECTVVETIAQKFNTVQA